MQIEIVDHTYSEWGFISTSSKKDYYYKGEEIIQEYNNINPLDLKLITGDIINNKGEIIIQSEYRSVNNQIPGILIIDGKTYGCLSEGRKRMFYKFIPDNKKLPHFLVPYEEKNVSFNKKKYNKYVFIHFNEWQEKHPTGIITNQIGKVNNIEAYFEYAVCCKGLNLSLQKFTRDTKNKLEKYQKNQENLINDIIKNNSSLSKERYEKRTNDKLKNNIFTIDPVGTCDYDDAIGIQKHDTYTIISIYIANVPIIIDYLDLWSSFTQSVSTIYLPNGKKNMIPALLADNFCSLKEGKERFAYTMDIKLYNNPNKKYEINLLTTLITVQKNYIYEEPNLLNGILYKELFVLTQLLQKQNPLLSSINDSHDVVSYYMILMNYECSKRMLEKKIGIYRITSNNDNDNDNQQLIETDARVKKENNINQAEQLQLPSPIKNFIKGWNCNIRGYYCNSNDIIVNEKEENKVLRHTLIGEGLDIYTHITSPIRRMVDLVNLIVLQLSDNDNTLGMGISKNAELFAKKWISQIDYINRASKNIKKVQSNCLLLNELSQNALKSTNSDDIVYDGYVIGDYIIDQNKEKKYNVYIPSLKSVFPVLINNNNNNSEICIYTKYKFIIKLFVDENNYKRKIRLQKV